MSITIDRAGRLVIPKGIRDEMNLVPGSELEIDADGNEIPKEACRESLRRVGSLGLRSGVIYDALHLASAEAAGCDSLYTFNLKDFRRLEPRDVEVVSP